LCCPEGVGWAPTQQLGPGFDLYQIPGEISLFTIHAVSKDTATLLLTSTSSWQKLSQLCCLSSHPQGQCGKVDKNILSASGGPQVGYGRPTQCASGFWSSTFPCYPGARPGERDGGWGPSLQKQFLHSEVILSPRKFHSPLLVPFICVFTG
jgi:hypothetical protein